MIPQLMYRSRVRSSSKFDLERLVDFKRFVELSYFTSFSSISSLLRRYLLQYLRDAASLVAVAVPVLRAVRRNGVVEAEGSSDVDRGVLSYRYVFTRPDAAVLGPDGHLQDFAIRLLPPSSTLCAM
ncbi:hypothetical protein DBV15_01974 [Temnothorax longispinosus]|uniref:Uncharacterized protein n=1 Tax=Temnothorax longispinosus TaxID=300112 RepID=A0A4S2KK69_9HYME|nr:hypothetical protein DBV15_01974 [Temnothorax longispinosus]